MDFISKIKDNIYLNFVKEDRYLYIINGLKNTILITILSIIIGIVIGLIIAIIKTLYEQNSKSLSLKILNKLCSLYLTVIRGTPIVLQLMIFYFIVFASVDVPKLLVAIIAFGINSGAYVAEIIRAGINGIDKGQMEAGRSLGLTYAQTMRFIILPQAIKNILPALGNESISLLKETAVAGYIAIEDLTKGGDIIRSRTYDAFTPLIAVAIVYLVIVMIISKLLNLLEGRMRKSDKR
jgi:His/Glu/Gln/Arg/opine family amino acid ABC transporter permease subunit